MARGDGDFVAGFLFGAFVGAILALLFAPSPGEELRGQIREKGIELKDMASDLDLEEIKTKGQSLLDDQKTRFQEAIEEGKHAAARKKEELLSQIDPGDAAASIDITDSQV